MPDEPAEEMTTDTLAIACSETAGLIEAICKVAPVKSIKELIAFLDASRKSPAHLRMLLNLLQPKQPQRR